jgi:uncharacterized membrane protein
LLGLAHELELGGLLAAGAGAGPYWRFLGVFHPAVAHFPIALLVVAALVESWGVLRGHRRPHNTTLVCLYIGAAAAVAASVLGWASADASGDRGALVTLHRWLGVAVAALAVCSALLSLPIVRRPVAPKRLVWSYRAGVFASAALVGLVGSYGGKLVHGESYYDDALATLQHEIAEAQATLDRSATAAVVAPPAPPADAALPVAELPGAAAPAVPPSASTQPVVASAAEFGGGRIDYARDVEPIFLTHCVRCHNDTKQKGGYRLDAREHVLTPGESGAPPVVPGRSGESRLVKMIEGEGEFADMAMPPKGKPLSFNEIALVRRWIDEGALLASSAH